MLKVQAGSSCQFKFLFMENGRSFDPTSKSTPSDVIINIRRGNFGNGAAIDRPFSYFNQPATPDSDIYIEKNSYGEFTFNYTIPLNLYEGTYSVVATTYNSVPSPTSINMQFTVVPEANTLNSIVISNKSSTIVNKKTLYPPLGADFSPTIMLVGHADGIPLNEPIRLTSMDEATNLLNADLSSPLLRGVLDAFGAGARNIAICSTARMNEYVSNYYDRNTVSDIFEISSGGEEKTFYDKYFERLEETYSILKNYDYIDYIVPLEASILYTGSNDFVSQLASFCATFHNTTGFVCMGVVGSRTGGLASSDITSLEDYPIFADKLTTYSLNGSVLTDYGRFVIPVYGEAVFKHTQIQNTYTGSVAAAYAGMLARMPLNLGLIKKRLPGAMFVYGDNLSDQEYSYLDSIGLNSIYRGKRVRRAAPYEVYVTDEFTMAASNSTLAKTSQMRLIADTIRKIKTYAELVIGRFSRDQLEEYIKSLLNGYKRDRIINDYSYNIILDRNSRGSVIIDIDLISSLSLKNINFSISSGPVM